MAWEHRVVASRGTASNLDPYIVLGSAIIGFLVGMTGAGGALMAPMLILLFGVTPSVVISRTLWRPS